MRTNDTTYFFECSDCKIQVTAVVANTYSGPVNLYCHRCKKWLVQSQPANKAQESAKSANSMGVSQSSIPVGNAARPPVQSQAVLPASKMQSQAALPAFKKIPELEATDTLTKVGNYNLLQVIGRGAMGVIYLAEHQDKKGSFAIKVLSPELQQNKSATERFLQEAKVHSALDHPNIVKVFEVGFCTKTNCLYLVMEFIDGGSLEKALEQVSKFSPKDAIKISIAIAYALEYAHQQNIVHRDLKPANILIDRKSRKIKVGDLGLGKVLEDTGVTKTGEMMGTLYYMPPEQLQDAKHVDARADIYALGATLYHMVAGCPPYSDCKGNLVIINAKINRDPVPLEEYLPNFPTLANIINKAMARDRKKRYANATQMLQDLQQALQELK